MSWMTIVKRGFGLKQFQKELIDEIMSDEKPRTAREVIEDWFDLIEARNKENRTLDGRRKKKQKNPLFTNNSIAAYKEVRYYLVNSLEYILVGEDDMGRHRYKLGG
tara:strand:+ start:1672 stop:1989 length:318 start_codon:yes stop_codon:yes gene_type:complete